MAAVGVQGHREWRCWGVMARTSGGKDGRQSQAVTPSQKKTYQDKMSTELSAELSATVDSHECDFLQARV